jgi:hypothetical protein
MLWNGVRGKISNCFELVQDNGTFALHMLEDVRHDLLLVLVSERPPLFLFPAYLSKSIAQSEYHSFLRYEEGLHEDLNAELVAIPSRAVAAKATQKITEWACKD